MITDKLIGKDAGSVGGLSSTYPKTFNQDTGHVSKDVLGGEVINIMQDQEEHSGKGCCTNYSLKNFHDRSKKLPHFIQSYIYIYCRC
jgi:hypothetical protein